MTNNEIQHAGIKGMKWGVRRYQNKDGTLTPAGKKRYAKDQYREATDRAYSKYDRTVANIEKPYKRGQNLSDKDYAREEAADRTYRKEIAKAKSDYKNARIQIAKENPSGRTKRLEKAVSRQKEVVESWKDTSPIKDKRGNTLFSKRDVEDIRDAAIKKLEKTQVKLAKSQLRDEINAGESAIGRIYNKLTNADAYQAEILYDLNKRSRVNKAWSD